VGGWLAFEHGYDQGVKVAKLLVSLGFNLVTTRKDYNGQDRVTLGQWLESGSGSGLDNGLENSCRTKYER
jgi:methylase of polypeptide subunit release factors